MASVNMLDPVERKKRREAQQKKLTGRLDAVQVVDKDEGIAMGGFERNPDGSGQYIISDVDTGATLRVVRAERTIDTDLKNAGVKVDKTQDVATSRVAASIASVVAERAADEAEAEAEAGDVAEGNKSALAAAIAAVKKPAAKTAPPAGGEGGNA